jgi:hypothetical protein
MLSRIGALLLILALALGAVALPATEPSIGSKIVAYCKDHLNQQVGDGECAALAGHALKECDCKGRGGKDSPDTGDYNWGDLALLVEAKDSAVNFSQGKVKDIRPGDIIQFRDAKFEHHTAHHWSSQSYHHHTAVVVLADGPTIHILQQNVGGKRFVVPGTLELADLKQGSLRFYHPIEK